MDHRGIMKKSMETTNADVWGFFWGYIGIMEKNMETTI